MMMMSSVTQVSSLLMIPLIPTLRQVATILNTSVGKHKHENAVSVEGVMRPVAASSMSVTARTQRTSGGKVSVPAL